MPTGNIDTAGRPLALKEVLHLFRGTLEAIRREAAHSLHADPTALEKRLSTLLQHALLTNSHVDIALILGCAAELMLLPETHALEKCAAVLQASNQPALRGLVWAARHKSVKQGKPIRRFAMEVA